MATRLTVTQSKIFKLWYIYIKCKTQAEHLKHDGTSLQMPADIIDYIWNLQVGGLRTVCHQILYHQTGRIWWIAQQAWRAASHRTRSHRCMAWQAWWHYVRRLSQRQSCRLWCNGALMCRQRLLAGSRRLKVCRCCRRRRWHRRSRRQPWQKWSIVSGGRWCHQTISRTTAGLRLWIKIVSILRSAICCIDTRQRLNDARSFFETSGRTGAKVYHLPSKCINARSGGQAEQSGIRYGTSAQVESCSGPAIVRCIRSSFSAQFILQDVVARVYHRQRHAWMASGRRRCRGWPHLTGWTQIFAVWWRTGQWQKWRRRIWRHRWVTAVRLVVSVAIRIFVAVAISVLQISNISNAEN